MATEKNASKNPADQSEVRQKSQGSADYQNLPAGNRAEAVPLGGNALLVDDEPINRRVVVAILQKIGLETEVAGTGLEALRMIEANDYSLVFMDIHMPEMSGFETTKAIRAREKKADRRRTTIIAMTANDTETTREQCLAADMDDFLTKPINPEILIERIIPWLNKNEDTTNPPLFPGDPRQTAVVPDLDLWNRERALEFVGGDEALLGELAKVFIGRNDLLLENIATAIELGDGQALQDAAHAYKGAVGHFASPVLRQSAIALENLAKDGRFDGVGVHLTHMWENSRLLCRDLYQVVIAAQLR